MHRPALFDAQSGLELLLTEAYPPTRPGALCQATVQERSTPSLRSRPANQGLWV